MARAEAARCRTWERHRTAPGKAARRNRRMGLARHPGPTELAEVEAHPLLLLLSAGRRPRPRPRRRLAPWTAGPAPRPHVAGS